MSTGTAPSAHLTASGLPARRRPAALFDPDEVTRGAATEAATDLAPSVTAHAQEETTTATSDTAPPAPAPATRRALRAARRPSWGTWVLRVLVIVLIIAGMLAIAVRMAKQDATTQGAVLGQAVMVDASASGSSMGAAPAALIADCPVIGFQPGGWSLWTKGSGLHQHVTAGEPSPFAAFNFAQDPKTGTTAVHWGLAENTLATAVVQYIDAAGSCRMTAAVSNADTGADTIDIVVPALSAAIQVAFIQVTETVGD